MLRLLFAACLLLTQAAHANSTHLECNGLDGMKIRFSPNETERVLLLQDQRLLLSEANLADKLPAGSPTYYFALQPNGKTFDTKFQMGTLVRTQFFQSGGRPSVSVDIVVDNRSLPKLNCPTSDYHLPVVPLVGSPARFAEILLFWGGKIDSKGKLAPLSLAALEATVLQFYRWPSSSERSQTQVFLNIAGPALLKIPPSAFATIRRRFTKKEKEFLELLLADIRYPYHPESQRFAGWVVEGLEKEDSDEVRGGFTSFFASPSFKAPDMRSFFEDEVKKHLPSMNVYELTALTQDYSPEQEAFILKIWGENRKAEYTSIKAAFPHLSAMENNLSKPASDFAPFVLAFSKLVQADAHANAVVRSHLKSRILPLVDKLPGKEKQTLLEALGDGGNAALKSLRK